MLFKSHQNMQKVIETSWSFYLLKYALKVGAMVFSPPAFEI